MKVQIYLNFGGNCEQALRFYEKHLGGKITFKMNYDEMPEPKNFSPGMEKFILHASMILGDAEIMASDAPPDRFQPMRSVYLSLRLNSDEEAESVYALLNDGGEIFMPIQETFFATRFAMLRDKFGVSWMIIHDRPMPAAA
ncbi:MAG: VOC family protein [Terracidiphilus sp.]|jgi:PhnB protein